MGTISDRVVKENFLWEVTVSWSYRVGVPGRRNNKPKDSEIEISWVNRTGRIRDGIQEWGRAQTVQAWKPRRGLGFYSECLWRVWSLKLKTEHCTNRCIFSKLSLAWRDEARVSMEVRRPGGRHCLCFKRSHWPWTEVHRPGCALKTKRVCWWNTCGVREREVSIKSCDLGPAVGSTQGLLLGCRSCDRRGSILELGKRRDSAVNILGLSCLSDIQTHLSVGRWRGQRSQLGE